MREVLQRQLETVEHGLRHGDSVGACEKCCVQVDVCRVALIVAGLLEVHAVVADLLVELRLQDAPAQATPPLGAPELWEHDTKVEQAKRFAGEVRVRAEVRREVPLEVAAVHMQVFERAEHDGCGNAWRIAEQLERPQPGDRAIRHLEAARPVHTDFRRVGVHPLCQMRRHALGVSLGPGQQVGAAEQQKMLMPIQLPDDLVVADDGGIEAAHATPMHARRAPLVDRVEMPIDGRTERQTLVAEQVKPAGHNAIRRGEHLVRPAGPPRREQVGRRRRIARAREEPR